MSDVIIKTGALPYEDNSGHQVTIQIEAPNEYFDHERIVINPGIDSTSFPAEAWPEVRAAIDRAVNARRQLDNKEGD